MRKINRTRGEGLLREMFDENRRMMRDLKAIDMGAETRNIDYARNAPMRNNPNSMRPFRPQGSQMPAASSRLNDQCFDFGERNRYPTEYPKTNESANFFQNQRAARNSRGGVRSAPYNVPVQNRSPKRGWTEGPSQSMTIAFKDEPGAGSPRSVWRNDRLSRNPSQDSSARPSAGVKGISNFLSPSPWFSGGKNFETSFPKSQPESKPPARYGNSFDRPSFSDRDRNGPSNTGRWGTSTNATQHFDNGADCFDNYYPEEPMNRKMAVPPESNPTIDKTEFYAKVCDAVVEKVLQHLRPDPYQGNQNPPGKSFNPQGYPNRSYNAEKAVAANGCSRSPSYKTNPIGLRNNQFQNEFSQQSNYPEYNASRFNTSRKEYAPKPSFNQSVRGRGARRGGKRKFPAKNRGGLL